MNPHGRTPTKTPPPQLSATFIPGDQDSYHLPVISPIPQRSMPEVPDQMQENLARLELDSRPISPPSSTAPANDAAGRQRGVGTNPVLFGLGVSNVPKAPGISPRVSPKGSPIGSPQIPSGLPSQSLPSSEPFFPHIKNPPPNLPARADETETLLESARMAVLASSDAESQLTWAQDALAHVHIAMENNTRMADAGLGRPRTPNTERQLKSDALGIVNFLADQRHPKAEFLRGMWLEFGRFGSQIDKTQAYRCYSSAARNGYARAEYRMGMQFEETGETDKALGHYNLGVQKQDAASYYRMGMMHLLGQNGQRQDIQRGLDFIRYSADNADDNAPQGSYIYGMLLARELPQISVPEHLLLQDITQAKYYLEKAAYLGFSHAQVRIGAAYELQQLSCDFDPVYSLHYNRLAARQGEAEAEMAISKWFLSGYEGLFPKNEAVAYEYALRAAQGGYANAEFAIGYFNEVGIHVPSNLAQAKVWYGKAAEHGSEDAKGRLTGISRSKTLSRKDHDNMALAKIKSVRGRPSGKQPNLQMPQIDSYRQPSPAPNGSQPAAPVIQPYRSPQQFPAAPNPSVNQPYGMNQYQTLPPNGPGPGPRPVSTQVPINQQPYRRDQQQTPLPPLGQYNQQYGRDQQHSAPPQGAYGVPSINYPGVSPIPNAMDPQSRNRLSQTQSVPPASSMYGQPPLGSNLQPTVSGNRQSSLPQGYRLSSQGLPTNSPPTMNRPTFSNTSSPNQSPQLGTDAAVPARPYAAADFGYSAPVDFRADRRRIVSGPGPQQPRPGVYQSGGANPNRTPIPTSQQGNPAVNQPQPLPISLSDVSPAPTPPPKATTAPSQRPSKGPSTFAEMGIPQAKKESDCVVM